MPITFTRYRVVYTVEKGTGTVRANNLGEDTDVKTHMA